MKKIAITLLVGAVAGICLTLWVLAGAAPKLMLEERPSRFALQETVDRIVGAATNDNWVVPSVMELDKSIEKHGGKPVLPVRVIKLCQAQHASRILQNDQARQVSVLMPCSIAVYEKSDGQTYVASMRAGLMGRLFGGVIAEVMAGPVHTEQQRFIAAVAQ